MRTVALGLLALLPLAADAAGKTMYVTRDGTKVLADKNSKSAVLTTLKAGDAVTVEDQGGNFLFKKVSFDGGKSGFIPYTALSEKSDGSWKKVVNLVKGFTKPEDNDVDAAKARSANAVMGIRGLNTTENSALNAVSNARPNLKAVYGMEERQVNEKMVSGLAETVLAETETILNQNP